MQTRGLLRSFGLSSYEADKRGRQIDCGLRDRRIGQGQTGFQLERMGEQFLPWSRGCRTQVGMQGIISKMSV